MPATYEPIASTTVGTATATLSLSSIPATYTDLVLVISSKQDQPANIYWRVNSDTSALYSLTYLQGNGSTAGSFRWTGGTSGWVGTNTATDGNMSILQFQNYANTNVFKTVLGAAIYVGNEVHRSVQLYRSTTAISSINIFCQGASVIAAGSTFSLYGIKAA